MVEVCLLRCMFYSTLQCYLIWDVLGVAWLLDGQGWV